MRYLKRLYRYLKCAFDEKKFVSIQYFINRGSVTSNVTQNNLILYRAKHVIGSKIKVYPSRPF